MDEQAVRDHPPVDARWTEHLMRAADAFAREIRGAVPEEFSRHARGSVREALLAVRGLIDASIERLDREEPAPPAHQIEVE